RRPAIQRAAADIVRISNHRDPLEQSESADYSADSRNENTEGDFILSESDRLRQAFDRQWRIGVHAPESLAVGAFAGCQQLFRSIELCHRSVDLRQRIELNMAHNVASVSSCCLCFS